MNRHEIIELLKANKARLVEHGVKHISLFGSRARDEYYSKSDVDLCIELNLDQGAPGFARIQQIQEIKEYLSKLLRNNVDIVVEPVFGENLRTEIERDRKHAF
ncbi:MAG: nucleotidyltransferase domain-containing protein [Nitratireductor sp.]|nr:nucleotidyltransferase domain-containing protein [Nitratireductor sp.]